MSGPKINEWHLQRLMWAFRKRLSTDLQNIPIDVIAEEIGRVAAIQLRASVLGEMRSAVVEIDVPAGRWQALKACFGLRYKKRRCYFTATQLFPDLVVPKNQNTVVYMEYEPVDPS